jgi:hypothetical protein
MELKKQRALDLLELLQEYATLCQDMGYLEGNYAATADSGLSYKEIRKRKLEVETILTKTLRRK